MQSELYTERLGELELRQRRGPVRSRPAAYQERPYTATERPDVSAAERRAKALGWFSVGLGLAQLLAPGSMGKLVGAGDSRGTRSTMLALGLRELTSGVALLVRPQPAEWLWTRVAGDLMDLALLGKAIGGTSQARNRAAVATAAVVGVTLLDAVSAVQLSRERGDYTDYTGERRFKRRLSARRQPSGVHVIRSITVNRPREEVYQFWRNFENFPRFMAHLESVRVTDGHSYWRAKAPGGTTVEWEAEIVIDRRYEEIAWRSLEGSDVPNQGSVRFIPAPGGRGTEIRVELNYNPPGGVIGKTVARLFGREPGQQISGDLRRFKQVIETGEVVHSDASIHRGPHPARPSRFLAPRNERKAVL